jgi:hypothetical protein
MSRTAAFQLVALLSSVLHAQTLTGVIDGTISDPSGVTEAVTGRQILVSATGAGRFSVRSLPPGTCRIQVEASGFATRTVESLMVGSHQIANETGGPEIGKTGAIILSANAVAALDMAPESAWRWRDMFATDPCCDRPIPLTTFREALETVPLEYAHAALGDRASDLGLFYGRISPARKVLIGIRANFWLWREGEGDCPRLPAVRRKS